MALNRPMVPLYSMVVATGVQFGLFFTLVSSLDLVAAGVGVTGYYATWALVSAWFVRDVPALLRKHR
jgi:O-antigen/teichoic acid export membrane protein